MDVQKIVRQLEQQKAAIERAIAALQGTGKRKRRRRVLSAAARARIARAQRKRWKALRAAQKKK
jgi:hypothetical protein